MVEITMTSYRSQKLPRVEKLRKSFGGGSLRVPGKTPQKESKMTPESQKR